MPDIGMHFHPPVHTWWCRKLFFFFLHTTILCTFAHLISHLIHHHPSQFFSPCRWWCRKLFFFFFLHTTICMYHLISLIHIHHNFHPILTSSFIHTEPPAPSPSRVGLLSFKISQFQFCTISKSCLP